MGEVAEIVGGGTPSTKVKEYWDGDINWYSPVEIGNSIYTSGSVKRITKLGLEKSSAKILPKGTVLFTSRAGIGNTAILSKEAVTNQGFQSIVPKKKLLDSYFIFTETPFLKKYGEINGAGSTFVEVSGKQMAKMPLRLPLLEEQKKIGVFFKQIDSLIALHQRKPFIKNGGIKMITSNFTCDSLFKDYFEFWIKLYKEGAVRPVTLEKYRNNQKHITKIIPNLKMKDFDRNAYQELLNQYALTHERQTVIDFHHQVKGAILDAVDDGLIDRDPTRKAIFKGKAPREKKQKYLNQFELHNLLEDLDLGMEITWDWLILLIAKTGLRFSEALGLTPADFDFARQTISVNKTWDYKTNTGFQPTKNRSSIRKVQMDWQLGMQFQHLIKNLNEDEPIFVNGPVCNSTPNNCLARHCRKCGIPEISIHGLRHTHASLLMFAGVSIASVSRRLGHSSITTTQKVYMHIINELENQDNDLVMRYLSSLS
ncbi:recombinase XerD [Lactobacillus sp. UMNPBX9]|nr:recombinase XerD [Lactobacillus sp. UMNPBX9]